MRNIENAENVQINNDAQTVADLLCAAQQMYGTRGAAAGGGGNINLE